MTKITPAEVLRRAADLIEQEGWVQGEFGGPGEGYCALGAIRAQYDGVPFPVRVAAIEALSAPLPSRFEGRAPRWNDYPGRKAPSVVRHLRKVARQLDARDEMWAEGGAP